MKVRLKVLHGVYTGTEFAIPLPHCFIGHDDDCYVQLKSESVSRHHSVLYVQDGKLFVRDLRSCSGTFVNGQPVQPECELHHGDELRVGPFAFDVHVDGALAGQEKRRGATMKELANLARITARNAQPFEDRDIAQWLVETEGLTPVPPPDGSPPRQVFVDKADHAGLQRASLHPPQDGLEAAAEPQGEKANPTAKEKSVKIPGSWSKRPAAASTRNAAEEALRILFRGR